MAAKVLIRKLTRQDEFERLVPIQRIIWHHTDLNLMPPLLFRIHSLMGGILFGAFVDGELAGLVYSFPAAFRGVRAQHSHLLAVLPEYQGLGIGKKLKLAQRREALKQGIGLITWTYDPMQVRNANLNLHALGVRSRTYLPDFYGPIPALCLGPGIPTDRLLVEWRIKGPGAVGTSRRKRSLIAADGLPAALERGPSGGREFPLPARPRLGLGGGRILVEVPPDVNRLKPRPEIIRAWQAGLRKVFPAYFARGYAVSDFIFGERSFYVLER